MLTYIKELKELSEEVRNFLKQNKVEAFRHQLEIDHKSFLFDEMLDKSK